MNVREATIEDLAAAKAAGDVTLIDVRNPDEYAEGHIPGAQLIPLSELDERLAEVPTDRDVHVVCQSGRRSAEGAELLARRGINAISVAGGTKSWIASGRSLHHC